jgi:hypothetical protein
MQEALGSSPLGQVLSPAQDLPVIGAAPTAEEQTSPTGYVPPPVLDSTAGNPGAFTDDPDILPQPQTVIDPYAVPQLEEEPVPVGASEGPESAPIFAPVMSASLKSVESLSMPAAEAAPAPVHAEPTTQGRTNPEPESNAAVMPSFAIPSYNVWASTQDGDKRSLAMPVALAPSQTSSIKVPEPQHVGQFRDPFADPPIVLPQQ